MNEEKGQYFNWDDFLIDIKHGSVIPIIGEQLYQVNINLLGLRKYPLYKYLAEVVSAKCSQKHILTQNNEFLSACNQYLKENNNDLKDLSTFLKSKTKTLSLIEDNPINKLVRIKGFNCFINATYDHFLLDALNSFRASSTLLFTYEQNGLKTLIKPEDKGISSTINTKKNILIHIFGNYDVLNVLKPAYTEQSRIKLLMRFYDDIIKISENFISYTYSSQFRENINSNIPDIFKHNLLFLGNEFNDCLVRFFICILISKDFNNKNFKLYVPDSLKCQLQSGCQLMSSLEENDCVIFYPNKDESFIDLLFKKMSQKYHDEIIQPEEFPPKIFISFEKNDRPAALELVNRLTWDGIPIWYDKNNLRSGDYVDEKITNAIENCQIFIPLNSKNTIKTTDKNGQLRYHIKEWQIALSKYQRFKKGYRTFNIFPVILDSMDNLYAEFQTKYARIIPNGNTGEYDELKKDIKKTLSIYHD